MEKEGQGLVLGGLRRTWVCASDIVELREGRHQESGEEKRI